MSDSLSGTPQWQGAHHLALVTPDLDATVRFYHGTLGMALAYAMGPMPYHGRHCAFRAGRFWMHFFEQPDAEIATPPPGWEQAPITLVPGAYQHIALTLEDEGSLLALHARLQAVGVVVTPLMNQGPLRQFLFVDNNGITIEANWAPFDLFTIPIDYRNTDLFNDPNPVPAVQEIIQSGRLRH